MKYTDISGLRFGRLNVIERAGRDKHNNALWICKCDCGNKTIVPGSRLRSGHTKSCGCIQKEAASKSISRFNNSENRVTNGHLIHGETKTPLYNAWCRMRRRCNDEKYDHYDRYGGRGISVCDEWRNYISFRDWALSNGYVEGLELDRINNDGNYEPSNCRWVTRTFQVRNRSNTVFVTMNGETKPLIEFCDKFGINYKKAHAKYTRGVPADKIFEGNH